MTVFTRRRLLKTAAVAGAGGVGLAAMGKFGSWAAVKPEPVVLKTARIQAKLMDVGPDQGCPDLWRSRDAAGAQDEKGRALRRAARQRHRRSDDDPLARHSRSQQDGRRSLSGAALCLYRRSFRLCLHAARRRHLLVSPALQHAGADGPRPDRRDRRREPRRSEIRCRGGDQSARLAARRRRPVHRPVPAARCRKNRHLWHGAHRQLARSAAL